MAFCLKGTSLFLQGLPLLHSSFHVASQQQFTWACHTLLSSVVLHPPCCCNSLPRFSCACLDPALAHNVLASPHVIACIASLHQIF